MYSILDRIRKIISDLNLSDSAFAKSLDIPQATFSNMFLRQSEPKPSWLQAIVEQYNVSPDWLLTGEGEMFRTQEKKEICVAEDRKIPILNQSVRCGPGQEWQEADISDGFLDSLTLLANIRPKDCYAFRTMTSMFLLLTVRFTASSSSSIQSPRKSESTACTPRNSRTQSSLK